MGRYVRRRLIQMVPLLFGISLLIFLIIQAAPGGPEAIFLENRLFLDPQVIEAFRQRLALDLSGTTALLPAVLLVGLPLVRARAAPQVRARVTARTVWGGGGVRTPDARAQPGALRLVAVQRHPPLS